MDREIKIDGVTIKVFVIPTDNKRWHIYFEGQTLIVKAPKKYTEKSLKELLENHSKVILDLKENETKKQQKFGEGNTILLFGKSYIIHYSSTQVGLKQDKLILTAENPKESYYYLAKKIAGQFFTTRVNHYLPLFDYPPVVNQITIRNMTSRHGVCNYKTKRLTFNLRLASAPLDVIDYVVVHEIVHLIVPNHSAEFYRVVAKILPDYKLRIKKLKELIL